jgi:hypothetical protein
VCAARIVEVAHKRRLSHLKRAHAVRTGGTDEAHIRHKLAAHKGAFAQNALAGVKRTLREETATAFLSGETNVDGGIR